MQTVWSTSLIPQSQRAEFWRNAVCDAFLAMTPRISRARDFEARLDHLSLGRIALNRVTAPAHGVSRTSSDIQRDEKQVFFLNMSPVGRCRVRQQNREYTTQAGELILVDSCAPYSIDLPGDGELLSLAVPRDWLLKFCPRAPDRTASKIRMSAVSHLLGLQMMELTRLPNIDAHLSGVISQAMINLLAGALMDADVNHTISSTRLQKQKKLIAAYFSDPDFGPSQAAGLAGISLRNLHSVFAQAGSTFGTELQKYRLEQACQMFHQSDFGALIAQVAMDCGFKSAEHFSRSFRGLYGEAPSQFRLRVQVISSPVMTDMK